MLIQEKVAQAKRLLKEFGIDCWITFLRESQINGDPTLPFLLGEAVTWHSAFVVTKSGRTQAIVGLYDKIMVEDVGVYDEVIGYVEGIKGPLQDLLKQVNPATIAANYSEGSEICDGLTHGMYPTLSALLTEIGMGKRMVSAERIVSALRGRKTPFELQSIRAAIDHTQEILSWPMAMTNFRMVWDIKWDAMSTTARR